MDVPELVHALLAGDLLAARQCVADAQRTHVQWDRLERPRGLSDREMSVAAGVIELLASRTGGTPPPWTKTVGAVPELLILDLGLEQMPRSFARAKTEGPEPLRSRNLIALPDFLDRSVVLRTSLENSPGTDIPSFMSSVDPRRPNSVEDAAS